MTPALGLVVGLLLVCVGAAWMEGWRVDVSSGRVKGVVDVAEVRWELPVWALAVVVGRWAVFVTVRRHIR